MNNYKSSAELKGMAKEQLFGNYGTVIGASLLIGIINAGMVFIPELIIGADTIPGLIIYYLVTFIVSLFSGIFTSGRAFMHLKLTCNQKISVGDIFYGFKVHPDKALIIQFFITLATWICMAPALVFEYVYLNTLQSVYMLLMAVCWIIGTAVLTVISLMLSQAFYLLQDFPQYSAMELLKMSCHIVKGHKGRLFYITLSFIPLYLLGILSCCIAFLWISPYANTVKANFYMDLMKNRKQGESRSPVEEHSEM